MNLNLCGQTPSFTRSFWINPSCSNTSISFSDSYQFYHFANGELIQTKEFVKIKNNMTVIEDESHLLFNIKHELRNLEKDVFCKTELDLSRLFCLIRNNTVNIFRGISMQYVRKICTELKKFTISHPYACKNISLIKKLFNDIFEMKPVKNVLIAKLLCDKEVLNCIENPFMSLPLEVNQLILKFFNQPCFYLKQQNNENTYFIKKFWINESCNDFF